MDSFPHRSGEAEPLLRPFTQSSITTGCGVSVLAGLAFIWCIVDQWNHTLSSALFDIGKVQVSTQGNGTGIVSTPLPSFTYPLTLAFFQLFFMGVVFLMLYCTFFQDAATNWKEISKNISGDRRWVALVLTHAFSIFWLQALMLPAQALSIGAFAASRAIEIPTAAVLRAPIVGAPLSWKSASTIFLASSAAMVLYVAYAQVSGCLCVWSGNGFALSGVGFWVVYLLILILPATNMVLQEGVIKQPGMHPVLMLGLQNLFACVLLLPVLLFAHFAALEDVRTAVSVAFSHQEVYMLVTWLCLQMAFTSAISVGVVCLTNSFWATSLRTLRVVYWWLLQVSRYYARTVLVGPTVAVSIGCPHSSKWSFVMLCGFALAAATVYVDRRQDAPLKKFSLPPIAVVPKPVTPMTAGP